MMKVGDHSRSILRQLHSARKHWPSIVETNDLRNYPVSLATLSSWTSPTRVQSPLRQSLTWSAAERVLGSASRPAGSPFLAAYSEYSKNAICWSPSHVWRVSFEALDSSLVDIGGARKPFARPAL
jgi:hypothetical protein